MQLEQVYLSVRSVVYLFGLSLSPALIVWLGMMLVSPPGLAGLTDERIQRMTRLRRGFARLIFRSLLWSLALAPVLSLIWLLSVAQIIAPIAGATLVVLTFGTWWLYVVVGSLAHAWVALRILEQGEAQ